MLEKASLTEVKELTFAELDELNAAIDLQREADKKAADEETARIKAKRTFKYR